MRLKKLSKRRDYYNRRKHMKYITVPEPVTLEDNDGAPLKDPPTAAQQKEGRTEGDQAKPVTLLKYLQLYIFAEADVEGPKFQGGQPVVKMKIGTGRSANKRVNRLTKILSKAPAGAEVALEDADWEPVKKIIEEKTWGIPTLSSQFTPLEDAWMDATEHPRKGTAEAAEPSKN